MPTVAHYINQDIVYLYQLHLLHSTEREGTSLDGSVCQSTTYTVCSINRFGSTVGPMDGY